MGPARHKLMTLAGGFGRLTLGLAVIAWVLSGGPGAATFSDDPPKRPALSLKATPSVAFAPVQVHLVAELKGGADDYQEYYCPGVEWDWGDETTSESRTDCEPYEAGTSKITRRFSTRHRYRYAGTYRVQIRLKQDRKVVAAATAVVQIRPGIQGP